MRPGEIHAVLGENGAGKSTLMKIIYGVTKPDAGTIMWNRQYETIVAPSQARRMGIGMVFQHFSLFETLTVWENIALALDEPVPTARLAARITEVSEKYGLPIDPYRLVHSMSVGERQRVEIVRCLLQEPKLLIMDEPTSVLTPQAVLICSRRSGAWRPKAAASFISATSSTKSARSATPRRCCAAEKSAAVQFRETKPTRVSPG